MSEPSKQLHFKDVIEDFKRGVGLEEVLNKYIEDYKKIISHIFYEFKNQEFRENHGTF